MGITCGNMWNLHEYPSFLSGAATLENAARQMVVTLRTAGYRCHVDLAIATCLADVLEQARLQRDFARAL